MRRQLEKSNVLSSVMTKPYHSSNQPKIKPCRQPLHYRCTRT